VLELWIHGFKPGDISRQRELRQMRTLNDMRRVGVLALAFVCSFPTSIPFPFLFLFFFLFFALFFFLFL